MPRASWKKSAGASPLAASASPAPASTSFERPGKARQTAGWAPARRARLACPRSPSCLHISWIAANTASVTSGSMASNSWPVSFSPNCVTWRYISAESLTSATSKHSSAMARAFATSSGAILMTMKAFSPYSWSFLSFAACAARAPTTDGHLFKKGKALANIVVGKSLWKERFVSLSYTTTSFANAKITYTTASMPGVAAAYCPEAWPASVNVSE
mmetsp:Transcript_72505/g.222013  ORF Transcript_72505/g.222013 Transcript_72505/m.222013 type:complete len:215 (-) Transcript_72505:545-1189(-)